MSPARRARNASAACAALLLGGIVATAPSAAPQRPAAGRVTLPIRATRSLLTFTIRRPGETIEGKAGTFSGEVTLDPADLADAPTVVLKVPADALDTGNRMRDRKMRSSHLETERFPEIVFRSTSIQVGPDRAPRPEAAPPAPPAMPCPPLGTGGRRALVEGVLSLHGVDRSLIVPASIRYDNGSLTAEGCVNLTYTDYGIPIPRFLWLVMDDDIQVRFRLVAEAGTPGGP